MENGYLIALKLNQIGDFTLPSPKYHPYYGVIFDLPAAFLELIFKVEDSKDYFHLRHLLNFILYVLNGNLILILSSIFSKIIYTLLG